MSQRIQVNNPNLPQIQPSASPVQRLVRPAAPVQNVGPSKLEQLAGALSSVSPSINQFLGHQVEQMDQSQIEQARAMRLKTALNYKEAVRQGVITPDQNPFFVKAWKEQDGRVSADQYNSDLLVALSTGPFASSTDHADTEKLLNTFRGNWITDHKIDTSDANFMDGFGKNLSAYDNNAREHQASAVGHRIVQQSMNNTYHEIQGIFDDSQSRDLPATATADGISLIADRGILIGMEPKAVNDIILDSAVAKAIETNSIAPFNVLDHIKTGAGVLGRTKDVLIAREQIQNRITNQLLQADELAHRKGVQGRETLEREVSSSVYDAILNSQTSGQAIELTDLAPQLHALGTVDAGKAREFEVMLQDAHKPRPQFDDAPTKHTLYNNLFEHKLTTGQVNAAYRIGSLTAETAKDLTRLRQEQIDHANQESRQQETDDRINRPKDVSQIPAFQLGEAAVKKAFGEEFGVPMASTKAARLSEALFQYRVAAQAWRSNNLNATPEDILKKASELSKHVLDLYPDTGGFNPSTRVNETLKGTPGFDALGPVSQPKSSIDLLTKPQTPVEGQGAATRVFPNGLEWRLALTEYTNSPGPNTKLGKILTGLGITSPEDILGFVSAQDVLYDKR